MMFESFCLFLNADDNIICVVALKNTHTIDAFWPMNDKINGRANESTGMCLRTAKKTEK